MLLLKSKRMRQASYYSSNQYLAKPSPFNNLLELTWVSEISRWPVGWDI